MIKKFFEYLVQADFEPIQSFYLQDELNPKVWTDYTIDEDIRKELAKIAEDYFESIELGEVKLKDIMLTGSNCNFNWSKYSDFDLHLVMDFSEINDDVELVKKYLDAAGKVWNSQHDITIKGYDVEIYSQDISEEHTSSGEYSLMNDEWIKKPSKQDFTPDEDLIRKKSKLLMEAIDEMEEDLEKGIEYEELMTKLKKIWKKIKEGRKAGLEKEGEFSIENLVFKLLRRNDYITKLLSIKKIAYDTQFK